MEERVKEYARLLGVDYEDLLRPNRSGDIVDIKHAIWFLLRKEKYKSTEIASFFNLRSHSTVIAGVARVFAYLDIGDKRMTHLFNLMIEAKII